MPKDTFITTEDAQKLTGYNADYLRRLVRNKKIGAKKFGRAWMISKQSLLNYLKSAQQAHDERYTPKQK